MAHKRRRRGKRVSIEFFVPDAQAISSSEQVRHKIHMEAWDPRSSHRFVFYLQKEREKLKLVDQNLAQNPQHESFS